MLTHPALAGTRPARLKDWPLIEAFHRRCSQAALYRRWGRARVLHRDIERLLAHCDSWISLDPHSGDAIALTCAGALSREPGVVDLGLQVADAHQHQGIGAALARRAAQYARARGAHTLSAYTEASNTPMLHLLRRLGPTHHTYDGTHIDVRIPLGRATVPGAGQLL
ncbi:GNAT family N-acetyltransferase [Streptomyces sp. NPDC059637]|uniref:GNAT family N-acetyltransferase n=1 Tax=Streptomyces sp. NPDC059637 TaxID=3347752 RepID=UPI0036A596D3